MTANPAAAFRAAGPVRRLAESIAALDPGRPVRVMHVCGTHEDALCRFGLRDLLPPWLRLVAGPGCPVCVCPAKEIDLAARLSLEKGVVVAAFGDVHRVPARLSLAAARTLGGDCRVVYSVEDALRIAVEEPAREVVFHAVGFETTACTTAAALRRGVPRNFTILPSHRTVPAALEALLVPGRTAPDGLLLPGHVAAVAGYAGCAPLARRLRIPMAVAGFEPVDLLLATLWVAERIARSGAPREIHNAYGRSVRREGNREARRALEEVFEPCDADWRGLGSIPGSGLRLRPRFEGLDARVRFDRGPDPTVEDAVPGCRCGEVLLGTAEPEDCPLFGTACTPEAPRGACMVAFEGTCHARHRAGRAP